VNMKIRFSLAIARLIQASAPSKKIGLLAGLLVSCVLLSAGSLHAQVNTGSLSGLVLDQSGAAVAGTETTVTSTDTGYTRTSKSLNDGAYPLPDLPIGSYSLTATANGFSQIEEKVRVGVGERLRLDLHLTVGAENQTVEVNGTGVDLERDDASIGMRVTRNVLAREYELVLPNEDQLSEKLASTRIRLLSPQRTPN
jgi:hypothetical protein